MSEIAQDIRLVQASIDAAGEADVVERAARVLADGLEESETHVGSDGYRLVGLLGARALAAAGLLRDAAPPTTDPNVGTINAHAATFTAQQGGRTRWVTPWRHP